MRSNKSYYRDSLIGLELKIVDLTVEEERRVRKQYDEIIANLSKSADILRQKKGREKIDIKAYQNCLQESDYKALFSEIRNRIHETFNLVLTKFVEQKKKKQIKKSFAKQVLALEALEGLINKDLMTVDSDLRLLFCNQLYKEKQNFLNKMFYHETTDFGKMQTLITKLINLVFTKTTLYVEQIINEKQQLKF